MKKSLVISLVLLVVGAVILAAAFAFVKFDFKKLSSEDVITNTYYAENTFSNIEIDGEDCKVTLIPSEDEVCKIVCTETEKVKFNITDENDTLKIAQQDNRTWKDRIGIFMAEKTVDVYLPESKYEMLKIDNSSGGVVISDGFTFSEIQTNVSSGSVKCYADADVLSVKSSSGSIKLDGVFALEINLKTTSGSIKLDGVSVSDIKLEATSGSIEFDSASCENLNAAASSGSVKLSNVIASGAMKVKSSSGSVKLNDSDASEIEIKTSSGSVSGTLLSEKVFVTETSSGSVNVPASFEGGKCYIKTSSGSINIKISSKN